MAAIFNSLKKSGKLGLACPATPNWSPWFGRIISKVAENRKIKPTFSHWKNPWFFLPTENDTPFDSKLLALARTDIEFFCQNLFTLTYCKKYSDVLIFQRSKFKGTSQKLLRISQKSLKDFFKS